MAEDNMKETMSALMDGELDEREMRQAVARFQGDQDALQRWQNYHLIGDALRKNIPAEVDTQLLSRINQAIASEAPLPSNVTEIATHNAEVKKPVDHKAFRPMAGFALAASVAAVAYVGVGMMGVDEEMGGVPRLAATQTLTTPSIAPMVVADRQYRAQPDARWDVAQPAVESRLDSYLYNHQAASVAAEMNGSMMPNVRVLVVGQSMHPE